MTTHIIKPRYEKIGFLHMRKQRRRSASRLSAKLISAFVFAMSRIVTYPSLPSFVDQSGIQGQNYCNISIVETIDKNDLHCDFFLKFH